MDDVKNTEIDRKASSSNGNQDPFLDGNDMIEKAISVFKEEQAEENLFAILRSIHIRTRQDGHFMIPVIVSEDEQQYAFRTIQTGKGEEMMVAFTSPGEYEKGPKSQIISNFIDVILKDCLEEGFPGCNGRI